MLAPSLKSLAIYLSQQDLQNAISCVLGLVFREVVLCGFDVLL